MSFRGKLNQAAVHSIPRISCSHPVNTPDCCTQFQPHDILWLTMKLDLTTFMSCLIHYWRMSVAVTVKVWRSNAITSVAFLTLWCDCMIILGIFLMNSKHWQKYSNMCNMGPEKWHYPSIGKFDNLLLFEQNFTLVILRDGCCLLWGTPFFCLIAVHNI